MDSNPSSSSDELGHLCTLCSKHPGRLLRGPHGFFKSASTPGPALLMGPTTTPGPGTTLRLPGAPPRIAGACGPLTVPGEGRCRRPPPSPALRQHSAGEPFPHPRSAPPPQSPHSSRGCNRQSPRTNGAATGDGAGPREAHARPFPALSSPRGRVIPGQRPDFVLALTLPGTWWGGWERRSFREKRVFVILTAEPLDRRWPEALGRDWQLVLTPGGLTPLGSRAQSVRIRSKDITSPEARDW